jgi:threonine synthase
VFRVKGTYEDAFELATQAIARWGWYNRNCAINPYLVEGKKTCSLEIYEQLGYSPPDWLVVSVGDGCIISGQWKAFKELKLLGEITRLPRLLAVQASGCKPIVDACIGSCDMEPVRAETIADSIRVGQPRNWRKAVRAVEESGGAAIAVGDDEIVSAMHLLGQRTGIFAEPAGAAGLAGLVRALESGMIGRNEVVAVLVTGSGLKDPESFGRRAQVVDIEGDVEVLAEFV